MSAHFKGTSTFSTRNLILKTKTFTKGKVHFSVKPVDMIVFSICCKAEKSNFRRQAICRVAFGIFATLDFVFPP